LGQLEKFGLWQALIDRPDLRRPVGDASIAGAPSTSSRTQEIALVATKHFAHQTSRVSLCNLIVACRDDGSSKLFHCKNFIDEFGRAISLFRFDTFARSVQFLR
jgi:hypothetical protein